MDAQTAYKKFVDKLEKCAMLDNCVSLLDWDERTRMPRGGEEHRAKLMSMVEGMLHEIKSSPELGDLISRLEDSELMDDPDSPQAVNIREARRDYDKAVKLPTELVEEFTSTTTKAQGIWARAKKKSNFGQFQEILSKILDLCRRKAEAYGYVNEPYDALLDEFEPDATVESISQVFSGLKNDLVPFVEKIINSGKNPDKSILSGDFEISRQELFGKSAAAALGFDFNIGRLDTTDHPFCTWIGTGDTRILTKYDPHNFSTGFFGIIHEAGHGIYSQGLPEDKYFGTPMAEPVSFGIDESQSLSYENQIGHSKSFWKHFYPRLCQFFPEKYARIEFEDFYFAIHEVKPSFIRIHADQVTYNLHIILRFEIEQAIMRGELDVKDIPAVWNEKFTKYFGITPKNDAEGCLQDIHWSGGAVGYFPSYSLGSLYAAQIFTKAEEDLPDMNAHFELGDFSQVKKWYSEKIHQQGRRYSASRLAEKITGQPLSHKPFMDYLEKKYIPLYFEQGA